MKAVSVRRGICPCGFPALDDDVPLGREYVVHPDTVRSLTWVCGGCKRHIPVLAIQVDPGGFMPTDLLRGLRPGEEEEDGTRPQT